MMNSMPMTPTRKFRFPMGASRDRAMLHSVDESLRSLSHSKPLGNQIEETGSLFSYQAKGDTHSKNSRSIIYRRSAKSNKRLSIIDGNR